MNHHLVNDQVKVGTRSILIRFAALALIVTSSLLVGIPAAHADEPVTENPGISGLEVSITNLRPLDPQPKKRLTVAGTVINRTDAPINSIAVNLRIGQFPVTSTQAVIDLDSNTSIASTREVPGGLETKELGASGGLAPQASTTFSFKVPFKNIAMPESGIYPLQVQAVDIENSANSGYTQTFLPWYPKGGDYTPINVLMYWPLSTIPNKTSTDLLMNNQTPTSLAADGRLNKILGVAGAKDQVTWVTDPSLIQTVAASANGYEFVDDEGQVVSGDKDEAAASWLAMAKQTLQGAKVQAMPYANSDSSALVANDLKANAAQSVRSAASTLSTDLGSKVDQTLAWLPQGRISPAALGVMKQAGANVTVLSQEALTAGFEYDRSRNPVTTVKTEDGTVTALIADQNLSRAFAQEALNPAEEIRLRQRILALMGAWPQSQQTTSVVVAPPTLWMPNQNVLGQVLATLRVANWVKVSSQDDILKANQPEGQRELEEPSSRFTTSRGTANYFQTVASSQSSLEPFDSVLGNPLEFTNPIKMALLRAESAAWRGSRREARTFVNVINEQIAQGTAKVRAVASEVVSVSGDSGAIPITLINDFDQPATIRVQLNATPSVRLESQTTADYKIPAKRKISVEIPIKVAGSEDLPVDIQLLTPDGHTWGQPEEVSVRSSAYARAATWVVIAAFVVLAGLLTLNSIRRRKAAKAEGDDAGPDSDPDSPSSQESTNDGSEDAAGTVHQLDHWRDARD